ncbi:MAG: hypothetical protein E5Y74_17025 [Mesorhizobium sp.]|nr:MAG: hypothetical protein E5Y74_17025 [Mesorhizobium sp.]
MARILSESGSALRNDTVGILPRYKSNPLEQKYSTVVMLIDNRSRNDYRDKMEAVMNSIIWMVGAVVIVLFVLSFFGLR